jgi:hypothetical protein
VVKIVAGMDEVCVYTRPQPDLLPQEKEQQSLVSCLRMSVRQIQSRGFSKGRRTVLLLHGEKAGMREDVKLKADLSRRNQMKADGAHPQGGTDGNSFPEFILGWTIGGKFTLAQIPFPANIAL